MSRTVQLNICSRRADRNWKNPPPGRHKYGHIFSSVFFPDVSHICLSFFKMTDRAGPELKPKCTPTELMLKVILAGTLSHYETRGMVDDKRLDHMLSAEKQILYKTHQESEVRYVYISELLSAVISAVLTSSTPSADTTLACPQTSGKVLRTS